MTYYMKALPKRGKFFRLKVYQRVGIKEKGKKTVI